MAARVTLDESGRCREARLVYLSAGDAPVQAREAARLLVGEELSDAAIAAYEQALADARSRAQALANETHQRAAEQAEASRKDLDAKLNERIADAEKVIADKRAAAMLNVRDIATEAATAIVERLIGVAPAGQQVANAVADTLKR